MKKLLPLFILCFVAGCVIYPEQPLLNPIPKVIRVEPTQTVDLFGGDQIILGGEYKLLTEDEHFWFYANDQESVIQISMTGTKKTVRGGIRYEKVSGRFGYYQAYEEGTKKTPDIALMFSSPPKSTTNDKMIRFPSTLINPKYSVEWKFE